MLLDDTSKLTTSFSKNLQAFMRAFGTYGAALEAGINGDPTNAPNYRPILDLVNNHVWPFVYSGDFDVYKMERDVFIPLIEILGHLRLDERINEMADAVYGCLIDIKGLRMEKDYLTQNVSTLIARHQESLDQLELLASKI